MADNKIKLLKILDIIKNTDEYTPITANEIVRMLKRDGINIERKAVYSCIKSLIDYGYDVESFQGNKAGYYLKDRNFEEWELKILIDAVAKMKFLNKEDTMNLVDKINSLSGYNGRKVLASSTLLKNSYKDELEKSYVKYNIDIVMRAISKKRKLKFQYTYIDKDLKRKPRYDGKTYIVNPYVLTMLGSQYYLICNYEKFNDLSYYRLDRIKSAEILESDSIRRIEEIIGNDTQRALNEFVNSSIYQFSGEAIWIKLKIKSSLLEEMLDYFESELKVLDYDEDNITIYVKVYKSDGLYYWLMQYIQNVEVLEPECIREEIRKRLLKSLEIYKN